MSILSKLLNMWSEKTVIERVSTLDISRPLQASGGYGAFFSAAYLACELTKARSAASLPIAVYRKDEKGREKLKDHPLSILFNGKCNPLMTSVDLIHWAWVYRDTFGTAYIWVKYNKSGDPVSLYPLTTEPDISFDPSLRSGYELSYRIKGDKFVPDGVYFAHEIIAIKTALTKDGLRGESLAKYAAAEVDLSIDLEQFYRKMLDNGNHMLGHIEIENERMTREQLDVLKQNLRRKAGLENAGEPPIFSGGARWVNDTQSMNDAEVINQQKWVTSQVCRCLNVPPSKIYEYSGMTYSSSERSNIDYAADTIAPEVRAFEIAFNSVLRAMGEKETYLHFELSGMFRGDMEARADYYQKMRYMGVMSGNEIRSLEDMNAIEGLDFRLIPANYAVMSEDGDIELVTQGAEPAIGTPQNLIHPTLLTDALNRIEKRIEKDGDTIKTQAFAHTVLKPLASVSEEGGLVLDIPAIYRKALQNVKDRK